MMKIKKKVGLVILCLLIIGQSFNILIDSNSILMQNIKNNNDNKIDNKNSTFSYNALAQSYGPPSSYHKKIKEVNEIDGNQMGNGIHISPAQNVVSNSQNNLNVQSSTSLSSSYYRGEIIPYSGYLGTQNHPWEDEEVDIYYNDVYVETVITNVNGVFESNIQTDNTTGAVLTGLGGVGEIPIYAYFDGNPLKYRLAGYVGNTTITVYGQLGIDVELLVTNPNVNYQITTSVLYENQDIVDVSVTEYRLQAVWTDDSSSDQDELITFTSNPHQQSYQAPLLPDQVSITVSYNASQLIGTLGAVYQYFTSPSPSTAQGETKQTVEVELYYTDNTYSNENQNKKEIALDTETVYIKANMSIYDAALEQLVLVGAGNTTRIEFLYNSVVIGTVDLLTDANGEVTHSFIIDKDDVTDITKRFRIRASPIEADWNHTDFKPGLLDTLITCEITEIKVTIVDAPERYYTSGTNIKYEIEIIDEFGRVAPSSRFTSKVGADVLVASANVGTNGKLTRTSLLPTFAVEEENKTLVVEALERVSTYYKYLVVAEVKNETVFNLYFNLKLTLEGPDSTTYTKAQAVGDRTWTVFNNTFDANFQIQGYNLTVEIDDPWGGIPLGAEIIILFGGLEKKFTVAVGENNVTFTYADLLASGFNLNKAYMDEHARLTVSVKTADGTELTDFGFDHFIAIYGPPFDPAEINNDGTEGPEIINIELTPDHNDSTKPVFVMIFRVELDIAHEFNIQYVKIYYRLLYTNNTIVEDWTIVDLVRDGVTAFYDGTIDLSAYGPNFQGKVEYYIESKDHAGYGLKSNGSLNDDQADDPWYSADYGLTFLYSSEASPSHYILGDLNEPEEVLPPEYAFTGGISPYWTITVYVNDSDVYSGIDDVIIYWRNDAGNNTWVDEWQNAFMTRDMGYGGSGYKYYFLLYVEYGFQYEWYYNASDGAGPASNIFSTSDLSSQRSLSQEWEDPASVSVRGSTPQWNLTVFIDNSGTPPLGVDNVTIFYRWSLEGTGNWSDWVSAEMDVFIANREYLYQLNGSYNYRYEWYFIAYEVGGGNSYTGETLSLLEVWDDPPSTYQFSIYEDGNGLDPGDSASWNTTFLITIRVVNQIVGVDFVRLHVVYSNSTMMIANFTVLMTFNATNNYYFYNLNLSQYTVDYGDYELLLNVTVANTVGLETTTTTLDFLITNLAPPAPPKPVLPGNQDLDEAKMSGLIWGIIIGAIFLIIFLFLWINRHTLIQYFKGQTLKKRVQDYLKDIIEDIKNDGAQGNYREALMKIWPIIEGVGREFYDLPRYKNQTTAEYQRLLVFKAKFNDQMMETIRDYYEKARYGGSEITENDFNSGVNALMKIIDDIETGQMKIET